MSEESIKIPMWFWVVFGICLVWNLLGVMAFIQQVTITPEQIAALSVEEQRLYNELPMWVNIAFACAVFGGAIGCLLALFRMSLAKILFMVSLVGVLAQMSHSIFISGAFEVYGPGAMIMPMMVVAVAIMLIWLANMTTTKGWLK